MKEVLEYLKQIISKNDKIVVACSGGPDSMCLLSLLVSLKESLSLDIICAHVNHNVRTQSIEEASYVKKYCQDMNITFETMIITEYLEDNFQNEARNKRYNFFENIVNQYNAQFLMTAHHADDLMETILMRINRGSTLRGYAGIERMSSKQNYQLVRPLLTVTKDEIIEFNEEHNIDYYIDASNFESKYTRNRFRDKVVKFLKKEDKNVHKKYLKFQQILLEYDDYINEIVEKSKTTVYKNQILNLNNFNKLEKLIQTKVIELIFREIYQENLFLITDAHHKSVIELAHSAKANVNITLPSNIIAKKSYDEIVFCETQDNENIDYEFVFDKSQELSNNFHIFVTDETEDTSNFCTRLNSAELKLPLKIRNRRKEDKLIIKNMKGHKKLNQIFIDEKVKLEDRNTWPIVLDANDSIIWLPGLKKTQFDKDKKEKYDIILVYQKKGINK